MPFWYWILAVALCFVASVVFAISAAYDREWPSKLFFFVAMVVGSWGIALLVIGGVVKLVELLS